MKPRTEQFCMYWDEHNKYPYFKKGKLKSYYRKKWFRKLFKNKNDSL